jgi:hypothetical protein
MAPRDHHFFFAKKMLPTHTFQSTDKMFSELSGPKREAFVFWLWNEAGKGFGEQLPHVAADGGTLKKLEVVGRVQEGGTEVIVISMPPALHPNEAMYVALVRRGGQPSVFFYERCLGDGGAPVHPTEAVLAEVRPDGSRSNHGFHPGLDLAAFKEHLGKVLGISLAGLEASLPPITMDAFRGAGAGAGASGNTGARSPMLENLLLVRVGLPLALYLIARVMPGVLGPLWQYMGIIYALLSLVIAVMLWVWLYRVHAARRGQTSMGPGWAVGGWFIPVWQWIHAPRSVNSAYRAATGSGAGLLVLVWWLAYLLEMQLMIVRLFEAHFARTSDGYAMVYNRFIQGSVDLPKPVGDLIITALGWPYSLLVTLGAYGILWWLVRSANSRL